MAIKRARERDVVIPPPANIQRRLKAEKNAKCWLNTYFANVFSEEWTDDRIAMLYSIIDAALYGGDQAIAGPRGEGKTTIATHAALFLMVKRLSIFPVVIGKSQTKAQLELKAIKEQLQQNELFIADYPEIGVPMKLIGGWSSRARMQTVLGSHTNVEIASDHVAFPMIYQDQLNNWPIDITPSSCGQVLYCLGIDGPVRGTKFRNLRPTLAIIDDIEDREAAESEIQIEKNEQIIEQDIGGLGASAERIPRVMVCTVQNRRCIAYRFTDPSIKPSWRGKRYRKMIKPPNRMDLVDKYIEMRQSRAATDPDAREAFRFWKDNQKEIEDNCEVSNKNSYSRKLHADGEPLELSAIHAYFNRVADVGKKAVATEIDNDPPEEDTFKETGIEPRRIQLKLSGYDRKIVPPGAILLTQGIDCRKVALHWVVRAWFPDGSASTIDYGIHEVRGTVYGSEEGIDIAIRRAILERIEATRETRYERHDASDDTLQVDLTLVDAGWQTEAVYGAIYESGAGVMPVMGFGKSAGCTQANFSAVQRSTVDKQPGDGWFLSRKGRIWLVCADADRWKQWEHNRWMTPEDQPGCMTIYGQPSDHPDRLSEDSKNHHSYARHITNEKEVEKPFKGGAIKRVWVQRSDNNHWLDASYYSCVAASMRGIKLSTEAPSLIKPVVLGSVNTRDTSRRRSLAQMRQDSQR